MNRRPIQIDDLCRLIDLEDPRVSPDERWLAYVQRTVDRQENTYHTHIWLVATSGGSPVQLTRSGRDSQPRWSPDGSKLAFTSTRGGKPQLYLISIAAPGGEAYPITRLPNGAHSPAWSPDGTQIAFLSPTNTSEQADTSEDTPPVTKFEARQREEQQAYHEAQRFDPLRVTRIPYRDGYGKTYLDGRFQQLYLLRLDTAPAAQPRRLTAVDADHSAPEWTPDGAHLLTFRPGQPEADEPSRFDRVYRVRVSDGETTLLNDEPFADRAPMPSPDGAQIAYIRTPHELQYTRVPRLALLPAAGGTARDLTLDMDRTALDPRWSGDWLYFRAHSEGNTEVYGVAPADGRIEQVVAAPEGDFIEVSAYHIGGSGGLAYIASTTARPAELFWLPAGAAQARPMTHANQPWLDAVIVQPTHELRYPSYDGASVQGWYLLPVGYEAGQRYPLVVHIHGGPRIMANPASKMFHEWQLYAASGYAVFFCNAHSSDGYGQQFQLKAYGYPDLPDHLGGVDRMIELGIADPDRLAITGGSYGGYMTAWTISQTDRFKVAIAERGVYNLLSQYGTTDFPIPTVHEFNANPWEVPMQVWEQSPLAHAHKIRTPTLILHSENDFRVLISEAEQLFNFMRLSGGTVEMLRFPREGHGLSRNGEPEHRIQRLQHMLAWFARYLTPESTA